MIGATLADRDRRALLLGFAIMLGLILAFRGIPAWQAWRRVARITASEIMTQAARTDALLGGFSLALDTLQARTAQVGAMGPVLLTDETSTGAASNLAAFIGELARQSLVRLEAVEMRVDSSKAHALPRVTVDLQATTDVAGLSSLLRGLEQGPTMLAVRNLAIRPQNADAPRDQVEVLSIRLTVEGLALVRQPGKGQ
jgi:hypothetical protein